MSRWNHPSLQFKPGTVVYDWDYLPEPPYEVQWIPMDDWSQVPIGMQCRTLSKAVKAFFEFGFPQRPGWAGRIVDDSGRSVLTWSSTREHIDTHGMDGLIFGVEAVFRVMIENDLPNMVDAQLWADRAATL